MRALLAELSPAERARTAPGVSRRRREGHLAAFRVFRLSRKDLRQFGGAGRSLWFVTDLKGSETDHQGTARDPFSSRQNSRALRFTRPVEFTERDLSGQRDEIAKSPRGRVRLAVPPRVDV